MKGCDELADVLLKKLKDINTTNIYIASFNRKHLCKLYNKNLKLGFITDNCFTNNEIDILTKNLNFISLEWSSIDEEMINYCKSKNLIIFIFTIKNIEEFKLISKFNVDGFISDTIPSSQDKKTEQKFSSSILRFSVFSNEQRPLGIRTSALPELLK